MTSKVPTGYTKAEIDAMEGGPDFQKEDSDSGLFVSSPTQDHWSTPTTYLRRFGDAMEALCRGNRPPDDMLSSWLAVEEPEGEEEDSSQDLQAFACEHGFSWAQGIGLIDAARVAADQPTEGVDHEFLDEVDQPAVIPEPSLTEVIQVAQVHSISYSSPHHFVMSVDSLRRAAAELSACYSYSPATPKEEIPVTEPIKPTIEELIVAINPEPTKENSHLPCELGAMCLDCQPRNEDGSCPNKDPSNIKST